MFGVARNYLCSIMYILHTKLFCTHMVIESVVASRRYMFI
jgi:hypothetical protein